MPELPEVETIVRGLAPKLVGETISSVEVLAPSSIWLGDERGTGEVESRNFATQIQQQTISAITRRGKMIIVELNSDYVLLIHLKMTGQLILIDGSERIAGGHPTKDMFDGLPNKSTRVVFSFESGGTLFFNDQRRFGYIKLFQRAALAHHKPITGFGIEPLSREFNEQVLYLACKKRPNIKIKQLLLDQTVIAGIGNIYADESLFEAAIHPSRTAGSLSQLEISNLAKAIVSVLERGLKFGGTSSQHFVNADGAKGSMQEHLNVYRRAGLECPRCGAVIERIVIAGRGTHFCPHCQN